MIKENNLLTVLSFVLILIILSGCQSQLGDKNPPTNLPSLTEAQKQTSQKTLYSTMLAHDKKGFEALLNAGADPNNPLTLTGPRSDKYNETVMRFAAELEDSYYLRLLLEYGGDPNARDNLNYPILFDTSHSSSTYWEKNHFSILLDNFDLLITKGADINAIGRGDNILTYLASVNGYTDVEIILNKYPNVNFNYKNSRGSTLARLVQKSSVGPSTIQGQAHDRVKSWLEQHGVMFQISNP